MESWRVRTVVSEVTGDWEDGRLRVPQGEIRVIHFLTPAGSPPVQVMATLEDEAGFGGAQGLVPLTWVRPLGTGTEPTDAIPFHMAIPTGPGSRIRFIMFNDSGSTVAVTCSATGVRD